MKKRFKILILLMGLVALLLHLPFINADPDLNLAFSRDANTDEGLNSVQVRNLVNSGQLTMHLSDNLVKTPLFGFLMLTTFAAFGSKLIIARLTVLLLSLIICLLAFRQKKFYAGFAFLAFILVLGQYYVFHYFHLALAEIVSAALIFFSVVLMAEGILKNAPKRAALSSSLAITLAYFLKIQFAYALLVLPTVLLLHALFKRTYRTIALRQLAYTCLYLAIGVLLFTLAWILPNHSFFSYVISDQTASRFVPWADLSEQLTTVFTNVLHGAGLHWFSCAFYLAFIFGVFQYANKNSNRFNLLFLGLSVWMLIEMHKLGMSYLPTRYLVSLFFAMGLIISLSARQIIASKSSNLTISLLKVATIVFVVGLAIKNGKDYHRSFVERKYTIQEVNEYLAHYQFHDRPVMGAWAPSLTWKSKAISYPIWKDYFNDKNIIQEHNPAVIIAEIDEEDSGQAFKSQGININENADSIRYFRVARWNLKVLWMKDQPAVHSK